MTGIFQAVSRQSLPEIFGKTFQNGNQAGHSPVVDAGLHHKSFGLRGLGTPAQLTKARVAEIKSKNSGAPLEARTVKIGRDGKFEQQFDLRENDAVLITLKPHK
jgi:hypothetical protein